MDVTITNVADLTALGQPPQEGAIKASFWLTMTLSDTTGGKLAHTVIDSVTVEPTGSLAQIYTAEAATAARGSGVHAYIVNGKPHSAPTPTGPGPFVQLAAQATNLLFPGVRADGKPGATWADTTNTDINNEGGSQSVNNITSWTVAGTEGSALLLTATGAGTMSGEQGGGTFTGTISNTLEVTSPPSGPATKAVAKSEQSINYLISQAPDPIPVKIVNTATLTALP
jgi:hypothetical protein